jgi:hypothetical protein
MSIAARSSVYNAMGTGRQRQPTRPGCVHRVMGPFEASALTPAALTVSDLATLRVQYREGHSALSGRVTLA